MVTYNHITYPFPNRGQTMFSTILEFCQGLNDVVQTSSHPVQQCRTFQCTIPQEIGGQSSVRQIHLQFLLPLRMCLQRAPSSRRTHTPTPRKHPGSFRQPSEIMMMQRGQQDSLTGNYLSRIFLDGANITARVEYAHDTIRPAICEKILTQCQGLYNAAQILG
jgi:hypothetical protein